MTFSREEALDILQLSEGYDNAQLDAAFKKLSRRYPPQVFSARFQKIRAAMDYLTDISMSCQAILTHESIDTSWLAPYIKPAAAAVDIGNLTDREFLLRATRLMVKNNFLECCQEDDEFDRMLDFDPRGFNEEELIMSMAKAMKMLAGKTKKKS